MKQLVTTAIVLRRTDYGEADRILTLLTPDHGKLSLLAKGVRRIKSKLAGGIELFSVSEITFIQGRGAVGTLVSTRLLKHYAHIVSDLHRTMLGYKLIEWLHKATEDEPEAAYFELLHHSFAALDEVNIPIELIQIWFAAQLIRLAGHMPNVQTDGKGQKLVEGQHYAFNFEDMAFSSHPGHGTFGASEIKFLRLLFAGTSPKALQQITGSTQLQAAISPLIMSLQTRHRV